MTNLSLSKKLIALGVLVSAFCALSGVTSIVMLRRVEGAYTDVIDRTQNKTLLLTEIVGNFRETRIQVRSLAALGLSEAQGQGYLQRTEKQVGTVIALLERYSKSIDDEDEKSINQDLQAAWGEFLGVGGKILGAAKGGIEKNRVEIARLILEECPPAAAKVQAQIDRALEHQKSVIAALGAEATARSGQSRSIATALALFSSIMGLALSLLLARALRREIRTPATQLENESDQLSQSSQSLRELNAQLRDMMQEQLRQVQSASAAAHQVRAMVEQNDANTLSSQQSAREGRDAVNQGTGAFRDVQEQIRQTGATLQTLSQALVATSDEMRTLVALFEKVSTKTRVISEIVFQTKLFSFNASVEAARAGEHGSGFAVVAEEVGRLAMMSGGAAREIDDLLSDSRKHVDQLVQKTTHRIQTCSAQANEVLETADQAAERCLSAFDLIQHKVTAMTQSIESIAAGSREQAQGVRDITTSVEALSRVSEQGIRQADETVGISQALETQARRLSRAVRSLNSVVGVSSRPDANGARQDEADANTSDRPRRLAA